VYPDLHKLVAITTWLHKINAKDIQMHDSCDIITSNIAKKIKMPKYIEKHIDFHIQTTNENYQNKRSENKKSKLGQPPMPPIIKNYSVSGQKSA